jgi:hypothetical protein
MRRPWRAGFFVVAAAGSIVGVACGGGGDATEVSGEPGAGGREPSPADLAAAEAAGEAAGGGTTTTTAVATAAPTTTTTASAAPAPAPALGETFDVGPGGDDGGCATGGTAVAGGAAIGDVDGDGDGDRAWVDGQSVGITTAAGGGGTHTSALAAPLTVLVANADVTGPVEVFVSDGSLAELLVFDSCGLRPVIGPDDAPFLFDLGTRGNGTGVGCVDVGGGVRELVGLDVVDDDGTTVSWERTVIELDGDRATIGSSDEGTFTHGSDEGAIALLHTITCHEQTLADDGIT